MVNFWEPEALPAHLRGRRLYQHNAKQTLVRTTPEENVQLGEIIASKLNGSTGPVAVYLPLRGLSVISAEGKPFHWPEADRALFDTLKSRLRPDILPRDGLPHQRRAVRGSDGAASARDVRQRHGVK